MLDEHLRSLYDARNETSFLSLSAVLAADKGSGDIMASNSEAFTASAMRLRHGHPGGCVPFRWKASWQLTDAFETWRLAATQRQELRIKTANAFQYLYLSLGQRAIKAWQEGVSYQQKVQS